MFLACFILFGSWKDRKNLRGRDFFGINKYIAWVGLLETNNFYIGLMMDSEITSLFSASISHRR